MPTEEQTYREFVKNTLTRIEDKQGVIDTKVSYTNGKVRKIIMALILLGGILIGQTFTNTHDIVSLFAGIIH